MAVSSRLSYTYTNPLVIKLQVVLYRDKLWALTSDDHNPYPYTRRYVLTIGNSLVTI